MYKALYPLSLVSVHFWLRREKKRYQPKRSEIPVNHKTPFMANMSLAWLGSACVTFA